MRPFETQRAPLAFAPNEAAPARNRVRLLALALFAMLLLLAGRAVQLAFAGDPLAEPRRAASAPAPVARADLIDRNGVLLATTVRAYALTADPARVRDPQATAAALIRIFPELQARTLIERMRDTSRRSIYLRRSLTPEDREAVLSLGLSGIGFQPEDRRTYPHATLAAHAIGYTNVDLTPFGGVENGLDTMIREAGAAGRPVRLSLDVRVQFALEEELAAAARAAGAPAAAAIILDGRTGEVYAMATWPSFDPNRFNAFSQAQRNDLVAGAVRELGSIIKPFTVAMALETGASNAREVFDVSEPLIVEGTRIVDHEQILGPVTLREILARSSNIGVSRLALRIGAENQRAYLDRLGLIQPASLQVAFNEQPIAPERRGRREIAGLGFGYGLAASPAALAGAYTVFVNDGARVSPTILARDSDSEAPIATTPVFSPETARTVLSYLRSAVTNGTGRAAEAPGLGVAGKTGTAEIWDRTQGYDPSRNFSSFAGVFPAHQPRYVIVLALDGVGQGGAGGQVAAPAVSRTLRRVAPMLGLRVDRPAR
ncbi:MAG: penicillin-binding protein 2 [Terricaulis sp.]|nr:penicillin-binding protein 2 [Terricaulis sp.]